jgi:subtilisin family serine protease
MRYERVRNRAIGIFAAAGLACVAGAPAMADGVRPMVPVWAADVYGGWCTDYVVVRVEPAMKALFDGIVANKGVATGNRKVDAVLAQWNVTAIKPAIAQGFENPELAAEIGLDRYYKVDVPHGTDTPAMAKALTGMKFFENVSYDTIGGTADTIPNDANFSTLWGMHNTGQSTCAGSGTNDADIDAPAAWDLFTGEDNVIVAVIDSGVDPHPDLPELLPGWNTFLESDFISDDCPHGTHCAGTVAAIGNNGIGVAGVSWGAQIMPVDVLGTGGCDCCGVTLDCAEGIIWAADHGAHVETMSLRYFENPPHFQDAADYAHALGVVIVAAAGNDFPDTPKWPASLNHVIAVGATTNQDTIAGFSSQGDVVDVSAPGVDVNSTLEGGYQCYSGTSMATPHVAGAAALLRSYAESADSDEIEAALKEGAEDRGVPGWDKAFGWGRINVYNSIQIVEPGVSIRVQAAPDNLISEGTVVSFDVTVKEGQDQFVPNSQLLHYRFDGGNYTTVPLVHDEGDIWTATLPAVSCGDEPEFYVSVEGVTTGLKTWPKDAPSTVLSFDVGHLETTYQSVTGFNNGLPNGWSADSLWHVTSACSVGESCDGGSYAYFGKDANCRYNQGTWKGSLETTITLPEVAQSGKLEISYCYTLQTEDAPGLDTAKVYINGVQIDQATESPNTWTTRSADITAYAGQTVDLAFTFDTRDNIYNNFRGWQIDGIEWAITDVVCGGDCYADYNNDEVLDLFDFLAYVNSFTDGEDQADCTGEGDLDFFDFLCFSNEFNEGC